MIRTLSTLIALTLIAGSASAAEVKVSLVGKDAQTIRADIRKAAVSVCKAAYRDESTLDAFHDLAPCVDQAVDSAEAKVRLVLVSSTAPPRALASIDTPSFTGQ